MRFVSVNRPISKLSQRLLVVANAIPVLGVLFLDWGVGNIVVGYLCETVVIGVITCLKICTAQGGVIDDLRAEGPLPFSPKIVNAFLAGAFVWRYGLLTLGQSVFVYVLFVVGRDGESLFVGSALTVALMAMTFAAGHGASFVRDYIGKGEYKTTDPGTVPAPHTYARVAVLQFTIVFGALAVEHFDSPTWYILAFVFVKTIVDLGGGEIFRPRRGW